MNKNLDTPVKQSIQILERFILYFKLIDNRKYIYLKVKKLFAQFELKGKSLSALILKTTT